MTKHNILTDLANVSKVPNACFETLTELTNLCIGSEIANAKLSNETELVLNIGIGTLAIDLQAFNVKFNPSRDLKNTIKTALVDGVDPLSVKFQKSFVDKLLRLCDEAI